MQIFRQIFLTALALIVMSVSAAAASRDWVGITDQIGDRLDITASGTLPISSVVTFSTGTIGISGMVTVQDGGGSLTVDAAALDVRRLTAASDTVTVTGTVTATATNFDIRDLSSVTDSVAVTGTVTATGTVTVVATDLDVRVLSSTTDSITATATDLDIRNLSSVTDSVSVSGSVTATGTVTVTGTDFDIRALTSADVITATGTIEIMTSSAPVDATISDGVDSALVSSGGELYVTSQRPGTWESKNYDVPATGNSGANLNPATTSMAFYLTNESSSYIRVCVDSCTASAATGLYVGPKGTMSGNYLSITGIQVYNPDSATASISILYARF